MPDWKALLQSGKIEKCKVGELKEYLKPTALSTGGEKGTLIWRIRMHIEGQDRLLDGKNPADLPTAALRKAVASRGLSCIGSQDEMLDLLMGHLKENPETPSPTSDTPNGSASVPAEDTTLQAIRLAKKVLQMSDDGDNENILRLLGDDITSSSSVGAMRKAYLKLSLLLHPDKLSGHFDGATRAFQAVVSAFEQLSRPETVQKPQPGKKPKGPLISRSNGGCHHTKMGCPRCSVDWGKKVEGNPDYFYNFMMMGAKTFTCSTCLLQFGCMSAKHKCPHCRCTTGPREWSSGWYG